MQEVFGIKFFFFTFSLTGGKSESNANLAEGMATTLVCFDDMNEMRDDRFMQVQKHCILICNSAPYSMPVQECQQYENKTVEQMATVFHEVSSVCWFCLLFDKLNSFVCFSKM